jgi:hypothetical protein
MGGLLMAGVLAGSPAVRASNDTYSYPGDGYQVTYDNWSEYTGNTDVGEAHLYFSEEQSAWNGKAYPSSAFRDHSYSQSWQTLNDYVYLFGTEFHPLSVFVSGQGDMFGKVAPFRYAQSSSGRFAVLNSDVGTVSHPSCGTTSCTSQTASVTKTLVSGSGTFYVSFVPVTVGGWIEGTLYEELFARGHAEPLNGVLGQFKGETGSSMKAGGRMDAHFYAFAGVEWLANVGVTTSINLIDVNVNPWNGNLVARGGAVDTVSWANSVPVTVSTMRGKVDVWGELFGGRVSTNIVSWDGYSTSTTLFDNRGARSF